MGGAGELEVGEVALGHDLLLVDGPTKQSYCYY